jgi:hypothetical protein
LKRLIFENGDVIPDVKRYFVDDEESDEDDWYILYFFVISHKVFKMIIMWSYKNILHKIFIISILLFNFKFLFNPIFFLIEKIFSARVMDKGKKICWYDGFCKRTDEDHFKRFAHPKMSMSKKSSFYQYLPRNGLFSYFILISNTIIIFSFADPISSKKLLLLKILKLEWCVGVGERYIFEYC